MAETPRRAPAAKRVVPGSRNKPSGWRRLFQVVGIGILALVLSAGAALLVAYSTVRLPDPNADFQTNTSFVYYDDGKEKIGNYQIQNRQTLAYEEIPQNVKDAIIAGENRSFWTDPGVSIPGMIRAAISVVRGEDVVGGSTITQQYIKVLYLTQDKSVTRKFTEILLAAKIGNELSKERILEGYLNTVYFGRGAYGIEAASQAYFKKSASKLTNGEAIALTAIVNNPGLLDPANGKKEAADLLERYQYTINGLVEMGKLTEADKSALYWKLPKFPEVERDSRMGGPKGYLLQAVAAELKANGFTDDQIAGGGLQIVSTLDSKAQEAAVEAAQKVTLQTVNGNSKKAAKLHAAIASIDVKTGGVIAMYGGPDFVKNNRNWATTARPTGSTFKPYALGAALRNGITLTDIFNGNTFTPPGDPSPVTNAGGSQYGPVTMLKATTSSINTAYVDIVRHIDNGSDEVYKLATDAGLPRAAGWEKTDRVPLGIPEVSPVNQAAGYATFANGGKQVKPHLVKEVKDAQGASLFKAPTTSDQTIESDVANDISYALTRVVDDGTARRAAFLGFPMAGKTGTRYIRDPRGVNKTVACWFVGFTKQISTAVMYVAGDEGNDDLDTYYPGFFGSGPPLTTWAEYMRVAQDGLPDIEFDGPSNRDSTMQPTLAPTREAPTTTRTTSRPTEEPTKTEPTTKPTTTEPSTEPSEEPSEPPGQTKKPPGRPDPSVGP